MKQFRLVDNTLGWLTFLIAAFVYCSTIEPTASFWDCPEFITTGYKLEIGHPPGAPFFMLTANLFSHFASDATQVARMVNTMSALLSATCILFLFWTITHLTRRLLISNWSELSMPKLIAIEASGLVGALIYTFSDTFWFSAVEGEVYAYSSAFTAVVFWLILKWEDQADEPHSDRWLILIMYMTGLSIGVHLLNLLCVPAIVLVYYYRRFPDANLKGSLIALAVSVVILAAVLYGVVPGIITVGGWFELFFVNTLGMPFNTGEIIYLILLVSCVIWAVYETQTQKHSLTIQNLAFLLSVGMLGIPFYGWGWSAFLIGVVVLAVLWFLLKYTREKELLITARMKNTMLLCMLMLMIGYSSYALIVIRSSANPPMDQNSPEDIFTLGDYLGREQYGQRPLFYGPAYTSQVALEQDGNYCKPVMSKGKPVYQRKEKATTDEKDSYFVVRTKDEYKYAQNMLFPRMYDAGHAAAYESWMGGVDGSQVPYDRCGEQMMVKVPSQLENLRFFLSYQCNFMYWRYFMWNFAGRQNDIQGNGELEHGNWITGFSFIDDARLGDQSMLPTELKENKGHNVFYCMPLILGLLGLFWQAWYTRKRKTVVNGVEKTVEEPIGIQQFWVVFFLFFMTGLAIVIYLNQTPMQPRERDYAYAGSFYAFAIWCGMGVAAIIDWLNRKLKKENLVLAGLVSLVCLVVPVQMASQTWDDHDRSGRYCCRDFGQNYLMTLQEEGNPIIFTNGDNDTFPLWYNQDTEGFRTDARVCNLSYLQTDWYIDQMRRQAYDSPSVPITWSRLEYCAGTNEYVQVDPSLKAEVEKLYRENPEEAKQNFGEKPFELKNILERWVRSKNKDLHVIPTDTVYVTIDKEAVRKSGMMMAADTIPDQMVISLKGKNALYKQDLMMLEMIAQCNWTRPIYVATTVGSENYMNLGDNFVQEGLANRITPFTTNAPGAKNFDTEKTYNNVMNKFKFGGVDKAGIYLDETVMRMCYTHRRLLSLLAMNLVQEGKDKQAKAVLAKAEKALPSYNIPHDYQSGSLDLAKAYALTGQPKKAQQIIDNLWKKSTEYMLWYCSLSTDRFAMSQQECMVHMYILNQILNLESVVDEKQAKEKEAQFKAIGNLYETKGGTYGE
jgi:phage shock protein PspC (stress-responsive transcriptional regulator)